MKKQDVILIVTSRYSKVDIPCGGDMEDDKTEKFDRRNRKVVTRFLPANLIKDNE